VVFFNLRPLEIPIRITRCCIGGADESKRVPMKNCYRIVIRHSYNDQIVTHDLGMLLFEQLRDFVTREGVHACISSRKVIINSDEESEKCDSKCDLADAKELSIPPRRVVIDGDEEKKR
jgi:hypothetical protein